MKNIVFFKILFFNVVQKIIKNEYENLEKKSKKERPFSKEEENISEEVKNISEDYFTFF